MRILNEAIQDVERYLRQVAVSDLEDELGKRWYDSEPAEVVRAVVDNVLQRFNDQVSTTRVQLFQVIGSDVSLIDPDYLVIGYNGYYYDFNAMNNNELFNGQITVTKLPVTQPVIKSEYQVRENISSVKGYVMLGDTPL